MAGESTYTRPLVSPKVLRLTQAPGRQLAARQGHRRAGAPAGAVMAKAQEIAAIIKAQRQRQLDWERGIEPGRDRDNDLEFGME